VSTKKARGHPPIGEVSSTRFIAGFDSVNGGLLQEGIAIK
jgi:hypothetical protein